MPPNPLLSIPSKWAPEIAAKSCPHRAPYTLPAGTCFVCVTNVLEKAINNAIDVHIRKYSTTKQINRLIKKRVGTVGNIPLKGPCTVCSGAKLFGYKTSGGICARCWNSRSSKSKSEKKVTPQHYEEVKSGEEGDGGNRSRRPGPHRAVVVRDAGPGAPESHGGEVTQSEPSAPSSSTLLPPVQEKL